MKIEEIRKKTAQEIKLALQDLDGEIFNLVNELKTSRKLEKPHHLKEKKRFRARLLTILTEKETSKNAK